MNHETMTAAELELMLSAFGETTSLREGNLYSYQLRVLNQIRMGLQMMKERFPGASLHYSVVTPQSKFNPFTEVQFQEEGKEKWFYFQVAGFEDDMHFSENYYGVFLHERYDRAIEEQFSQEGIHLRAYTEFPDLKENAEIDWTVNEMIAMGNDLGRNTSFFLTESMSEERVKQIKAKAEEMGLYGAYTLYFFADDEQENVPVEELYQKVRSQNCPYPFEKTYFSCFGEESEG